MKPTSEKFMKAAAMLCRLIPFAPREDEDIALLSDAMECYVATEDQLRWLTMTAVNAYDKWPGIKAFRDLHSSRFAPANTDTLELQEMAPEIRHAIQSSREWDAKIAEWKAENRRRLLAGEVTQVCAALRRAQDEIEPPVELVQAAVKTIPKPALVVSTPEYLRNADVPPSERQQYKTLRELEAELEFLKRPTRSTEETAQLIEHLETKLGIQKQTVQ